jgi:hypothetical protein
MSHGPTVADYFPSDKASHAIPALRAVFVPQPRAVRLPNSVDVFGSTWDVLPHIHATPKEHNAEG